MPDGSRGPGAGSAGSAGAKAYPAAVGLVVLSACAALVLATTWGIGVSPDSVGYFRGAEKLHEGAGVFSLDLHWPPGYPALLAAGWLFAADLLVSTRALHVLLFGVNVLLVSLATMPRSWLGRIAALGALVFFASSTLSAHTMAWSEIPFVSLQLGAALLLVASLKTSRSGLLAASASLAALSVLMRFAGFAFAAVAALFVLIYRPGRLPVRLRLAAIYGAVACAPALVYLLGNQLLHGEAMDRTLLAPSLPLENLAPALPALVDWFDPANASLGAVLGAGCFGLLGWRVWRSRSERSPTREGMLVAFAVAYVAGYLLLVLGYMVLLDRYLTINDRILIPAQVFLGVGFFVAFVGCAEQPKSRGLRLAALALLGVLVVSNADATAGRVEALAAHGQGHLRRAIRRLPMWDALRRIDAAVVYTNGPDLVYLYLRRPSVMIPRRDQPVTGLPNPLYRSQMSRIVAEVQNGDAALVIFTRFRWRSYLPGPNALERDFPLRAVYRGPDGVIYARARSG